MQTKSFDTKKNLNSKTNVETNYVRNKLLNWIEMLGHAPTRYSKIESKRYKYKHVTIPQRMRIHH